MHDGVDAGAGAGIDAVSGANNGSRSDVGAREPAPAPRRDRGREETRDRARGSARAIAPAIVHARARRRSSPGWRAHLAALGSHVARDGALVAALYLVRAIDGALRRLGLRCAPRDPGERAAERFLRALGYRTVARNWRSPRDPRDEADLLMLAPDRATVVIVEVKRARGPWDALDRVDRRKREVLWRLLGDVAEGDDATRAVVERAGADRVRVDLVGVRGEGRGASAVRHVVGLFERKARDRPRGLEPRGLEPRGLKPRGLEPRGLKPRGPRQRQ